VIGTAQIPATLTLSGFIAWTNLNNNTVTLTQRITPSTGNVSDASFVGLLETPLGDLPFSVDETAQQMPVLNTRLMCDAPSSGACLSGQNPKLFFDSLDVVAIDNRENSLERTFMNNPFIVTIGETSGVTWRIEIDIQFIATTYIVPPPTPVPTGPAWILLAPIVAAAGHQMLRCFHRA